MKTITIDGFEGLENAMNRLQFLDAQVNTAAASISERIALMRGEVMEKQGANIEEHKLLTNKIEQFCFENAKNTDLFPAGKKSLVLAAGTLSFRTGPLSIALKKGVKSESVLDAAKKMKLIEIIRTPAPELNKDAVKELIANGDIGDEELKALGLVASQSESLTIKLND